MKLASHAMFTIEPYQQKDFPVLVSFVVSLQEHERQTVPALKPGAEIGAEYAASILKNVAENAGIILIARAAEQAVGFVSAWIDKDDDPLLQDNVRDHAYVSDIFVTTEWRAKGVGRALLDAIEMTMAAKGCRLIRVCAKATNQQALHFYQSYGFSSYEVIL